MQGNKLKLLNFFIVWESLSEKIACKLDDD